MRGPHVISRGCAALAILCLVAAAASSASATPAPSQCPSQTLVRPFLPWHDLSQYFLAPEGSMESLGTWSLSNASAVSDNEPFHLNSRLDTRSLSLGPSGSATTAPICVTVHSPTMRFFLRNMGSLSSTLRVDVLFTDRYGRSSQAPLGYLTAGYSWAPSSQVVLLRSVAPLVNGNGQTWVRLRFTPTGSGGNWRLDDLYLDPLKGV